MYKKMYGFDIIELVRIKCNFNFTKFPCSGSTITCFIESKFLVHDVIYRAVKLFKRFFTTAKDHIHAGDFFPKLARTRHFLAKMLGRIASHERPVLPYEHDPCLVSDVVDQPPKGFGNGYAVGPLEDERLMTICLRRNLHLVQIDRTGDNQMFTTGLIQTMQNHLLHFYPNAFFKY